MRSEYIWAAVSAVVVGVIGVVLLYLGGVAGKLPKAFGLFDMTNNGIRALVIVILLVAAALLLLAYRNTAKNPSDKAGS